MSDPAAARSRDVSSTSTEPPSETSRFSASRPGGGAVLLKARVTAPRRPHESNIVVVIKKPLPGKRAAETFNVIPPPPPPPQSATDIDGTDGLVSPQRVSMRLPRYLKQRTRAHARTHSASTCFGRSRRAKSEEANWRCP